MSTVPIDLHIFRRPGGYAICDSADRLVCMIYCREPESVARAAKVLTFPEGEAMAKRIARALTGPNGQ